MLRPNPEKPHFLKIPSMNQILTTPDGEAIVLCVAGEGGEQVPLLAAECVRTGDVASMRDETWLQGLRSGELPWDPSSLEAAYHAWRRGNNTRLTGIILELSNNGQRVRRLFHTQCFDLTLQRALERPLARGALSAEQQVHYWLATAPAETVALPVGETGEFASAPAGMQVRVRPPAWRPEPARLAQYIEGSDLPASGARPAEEEVETESGRSPHVPVFFGREAWDEGRRFAFRRRNVESAAIFTGRLMQDIDSPEVFVVVNACIAAPHAEEERYSVLLTNESWSQVHSVLGQRRRRLNRPQEIIVGSVHGHNFPPSSGEDGEPACAACERRQTCEKTSAVASSEDLSWHRSIFAGQPWATMLIWGWNARHEEVWQAYGLGGGMLVARAVRVLRN